MPTVPVIVGVAKGRRTIIIGPWGYTIIIGPWGYLNRKLPFIELP